jgi:hypothetical protein
MGTRFGRRSARLAAVGALLAVPALVGATAGTATAAPLDSQVSLGDSYSAGPLITPQDPTSLGCLRSLVDYPHLVAQQKGYQLTDVSCSGATTDDMFSPQKGYDGRAVAPQLDALKADTDVVTLGIGGNDIGFTGIIENCIAYTPVGPTVSGTQNCRDGYTAGGTDQLAQRIRATRPKVVRVLQAIHARSPHAKVYLVGYPAILPESGACWPQMPLTVPDTSYLRGVEKTLDGMLASAAATNGATYVNTYRPTIGHDACKLPALRYIEPLVPVGDAAPVHPNRFGEAALARVVAGKIS